MSDEMVGAVMLGGPFDGDGGLLEQPVPDSIWCFVCPHGGRGATCEFGGVHWSRHEEDAPPCGAHEYVWSMIDDADRHVYRYGDLADPAGLEAHEEVPELVGA